MIPGNLSLSSSERGATSDIISRSSQSALLASHPIRSSAIVVGRRAVLLNTATADPASDEDDFIPWETVSRRRLEPNVLSKLLQAAKKVGGEDPCLETESNVDDEDIECKKTLGEDVECKKTLGRERKFFDANGVELIREKESSWLRNATGGDTYMDLDRDEDLNAPRKFQPPDRVEKE